MKQIKITFYPTLILIIALFCAVFMTLFLDFFCKYYIGGEEGNLIFIFECVMFVIQVPTSIYLIKRIRKQNDLYVIENEIFQNNISLFDRRDIISIKKIGLFKVVIKYNKDNEEKVVYAAATNKKLKTIKEILCIYD